MVLALITQLYWYQNQTSKILSRSSFCRPDPAAADDDAVGGPRLPGRRFPSRHRRHPAHPLPIGRLLSCRHRHDPPEAGLHRRGQGHPHVCQAGGESAISQRGIRLFARPIGHSHVCKVGGESALGQQGICMFARLEVSQHCVNMALACLPGWR